MSKLAIIVHVHAKPEHVERVKAYIESLVPITRAEKGCLQYDLHQDNEDPNHFMFYELWESRELWQIHMNTPHLKAYFELAEEAVASSSLDEMSVIG